MSTTKQPLYLVLPVSDLIEQFDRLTRNLRWHSSTAVNYLSDICTNLADKNHASENTLNYMYDIDHEFSLAPVTEKSILTNALYEFSQALYFLLEMNQCYDEEDLLPYVFEQFARGNLVMKHYEDEPD